MTTRNQNRDKNSGCIEPFLGLLSMEGLFYCSVRFFFCICTLMQLHRCPAHATLMDVVHTVGSTIPTLQEDRICNEASVLLPISLGFCLSKASASETQIISSRLSVWQRLFVNRGFWFCGGFLCVVLGVYLCIIRFQQKMHKTVADTFFHFWEKGNNFPICGGR